MSASGQYRKWANQGLLFLHVKSDGSHASMPDRRSLFIQRPTPGARTDADHAGEGPGYVTLIGGAAALGEREIMIEVARGRLSKQIAGDAGIAEATVKVHRSRLMRKMKARSLPALSRMADKLQLMPPSGAATLAPRRDKPDESKLEDQSPCAVQ